MPDLNDTFYYTCCHCDGSFPLDELLSIDAVHLYCLNCFHEHMVECCCCHSRVPDSESYSVMNDNGRLEDYCSNCYHRDQSYCSRCRSAMHASEAIEIRHDLYCPRCVQSFSTCVVCHHPIHPHDRFLGVDGHSCYCRSCYNNAEVCYACGYVIPAHGDSHMLDGETYCDRCYDQHSWETYIHEYGYKPRPVFYGSGKPHFGIELEVAFQSNSEQYHRDLSSAVALVHDIVDPWAYLKHDSSIRACGYNGFEIVTHPLSMDWIKGAGHDCIRQMLETSQIGMRSFGTNTCGMHIHVSKNDLSRLQIYKMMKLMYQSSNRFVFRISDRTSTSFNRWCPLETSRGLVRAAYHKYDEMRGALNLLPSRTVEFRIFRGTLTYTSFMKNIEFVDALIAFTANGKFSIEKDMKPVIFRQYVWENRKRWPHLTKSLLDLYPDNDSWDNAWSGKAKESFVEKYLIYFNKENVEDAFCQHRQ